MDSTRNRCCLVFAALLAAALARPASAECIIHTSPAWLKKLERPKGFPPGNFACFIGEVTNIRTSDQERATAAFFVERVISSHVVRCQRVAIPIHANPVNVVEGSSYLVLCTWDAKPRADELQAFLPLPKANFSLWTINENVAHRLIKASPYGIWAVHLYSMIDPTPCQCPVEDLPGDSVPGTAILPEFDVDLVKPDGRYASLQWVAFCPLAACILMLIYAATTVRRSELGR